MPLAKPWLFPISRGRNGQTFCPLCFRNSRPRGQWHRRKRGPQIRRPNATGAAEAPGARLHVLSIGISEYGDKSPGLRLKFAAKDANDVASALVASQGGEFNKKGGLYARVLLQYLHDKDADRAEVFTSLETMKMNMAKNPTAQDLAVILFSGHGATIGDQFYLLPYGVDVKTPGASRHPRFWPTSSAMK